MKRRAASMKQPHGDAAVTPGPVRVSVAAIIRFTLPGRLSALVGSSRAPRRTARFGLILIALTGLFAMIPAAASAACGNPVQCEKQLPGDAPSDWQVDGSGDPTIQGYATSMGVNVGSTEYFKINTPSTSYHI